MIWASDSPLLELMPLLCTYNPPAFQDKTDSAVAKLPARLGLRVVVAARQGRERDVVVKLKNIPDCCAPVRKYKEVISPPR